MRRFDYFDSNPTDRNADLILVHNSIKVDACELIDLANEYVDKCEKLEQENQELKNRYKWRKYPDEKPVKEGEYLVKKIWKNRFFNLYWKDDRWQQRHEVTHWMPLPEVTND